MIEKLNNLISEDIKLIEKDHKYVLGSNKGIHFRSVTEIIDSHFKPFDKWRVARALTKNNHKYQQKYDQK